MGFFRFAGQACRDLMNWIDADETGLVGGAFVLIVSLIGGLVAYGLLL